MDIERIPGRIPALECIRAGKRRVHKLYVRDKAKGVDALIRAAKDIPVQRCNKSDLDRLVAGVNHQGVVLEADPLPVERLSEWLSRNQTGDSLVMILDGVEDPHNLGAIARSAAACGANALLFGKDRAAPISPASVKSAAGAMEYIDLIQEPSIVRSMQQLKKAQFWITGLDADAPQTFWETDLKGRRALVIGSEGKGMRRLVREHCDLLARIPINGPITSLNASASAAIVLVECVRQRG